MDNSNDSKERKESPAGEKGGQAPASPIREALRQVESFGQALGEALQGRGNVVMVRVNDETLQYLDMLVEAEITKSRSESAAYLMHEGIRAKKELFDKIGEVTDQIARLRSQLKNTIETEK
ncbi:MAG: hypothetical protein JXA20_18195 [Spirochaetes bacterium]|nr:hypothetical protein [Spirochaetota bacterium]